MSERVFPLGAGNEELILNNLCCPAKGSVITDYQYDVNTRNDASFIKEYLENESKTDEPSVLITDGAYASEETVDCAVKKISS